MKFKLEVPVLIGVQTTVTVVLDTEDPGAEFLATLTPENHTLRARPPHVSELQPQPAQDRASRRLAGYSPEFIKVIQAQAVAAIVHGIWAKIDGPGGPPKDIEVSVTPSTNVQDA